MTELAEPASSSGISVGEDSLVIDIEMDERVCYALSFNKRPPIRKVTLRNVDGTLRGPSRVTITSEWTSSNRPPIRELNKSVDLREAGSTVEVEFRDSRLDDLAMAYLDERTTADLIVTVTDERGTTVSKRTEFTILARNQWRGDLFELTTAFVQSQHPEVKKIVADASRLLRSKGVDDSIAGSQGGPEEKLLLAEAIFDAMSKRIEFYIESPPTIRFQKEGQRVRPLDQILESRGGNCIELACAYSACLMEAGLEPVIFLLHGHAFAGFYLDPRNPDNRWNLSLTTEFASISNVMDRNAVIPVETTLIPGDASFSSAINATKKHFVERDPLNCGHCRDLVGHGEQQSIDPHMEAVIDVLRSMADGVNPLPARSINEDGQETLVIYVPGGAPPIIERRDPITHRPLPEVVPARIQRWKNLLLDLSKRSPLISFTPHLKGIELVVPEEHLGAIEDYLLTGQSLSIKGLDDLSGVLKQTGIDHVQKLEPETLQTNWQSAHVLFGFANAMKKDDKGVQQPSTITVEKRARDLQTKTRSAEQDTGVNNLHLALGLVTWPFRGLGPGGDSTDTVTSPLFLVPIRMTLPRGKSVPVISLAPDSMTTVNYSLLESLRGKFNLTLEWFNEDMSDDSGLDIDRGIDVLRKELHSSGLSDMGVRIDDRAALGVFPFNRIRLWKDLNDHWEEFLENPVVKHMVEVGTGNFHDPADPDSQGVSEFNDLSLLNPQPADGAQTRAIVKALDGQSFVLEGPPGTGKSQTITNLLANALARGMKVLFVAEKPEARAVVHERLQAVGLDPFCLDLHDQGSKPEDVKAQLRDALDFQPADVEDRWERIDQAFQVISESLSSYRNRIHGTTDSGRSYFDSHDLLLEIGAEPTAHMGRELANRSPEEVSEIRDVLLHFPEFADPAQVQSINPWGFVGSRNFESLERKELTRIIQQLGSTEGAVRELDGVWGELFNASTSWSTFRSIAAALSLEDQGGMPTSSDWRAIMRSDWSTAVEKALSDIELSIAFLNSCAPEVGSEILERNLEGQNDLVRAAASSFVLGRKKKLLVALGDLGALPIFAELNPTEVINVFSELNDASRSYRAAVDRLKSSEGMKIRSIEAPIDDQILNLLRARFQSLTLVARELEQTGVFSQSLEQALSSSTRIPDHRPASELIDLLSQMFDLLQSSEELIEEWVGSNPFMGTLTHCLRYWEKGTDGSTFISLSRWISLLNHLSPLETELYLPLRSQLLTADIPSDEAATVFERAILNAVLTTVGEDNKFDVFDQNNQDRMVAKFVELVQQREALLRDLIPARLFENRKFDASANTGTVGNLRTELSSKRRGARSVRDLIVRYPEIISELTPCFLMAPDSVAKFIPPDSIEFDLVVFDEASQIRVEDAIGALGRSKAVVIVGDSRQMPPSSGFMTKVVGLEDDDLMIEDLNAFVQDAESILEESVESGLPREMLSWHYRSKDEILIDFSNKEYYEGRLASFPSPFITRPGVGVEYHRVDGQFMHSGSVKEKVQTNPIEADAIVAEVLRRVNDPQSAEDSIGVIALNKAQAELITKLLIETNDPKVLELMDADDLNKLLFVKNLENVQGRERDVIILGTSFSNKFGTDKMPLQFGPLTSKGGERRLNVAITRARKQMVIFSSFDPEQLARAGSRGLQDLGAYLALAKDATLDREAFGSRLTTKPDRYTTEVATALRERGLKVTTNYGLSNFKVDIAVGLPGIPDRWLLGVLLDGRDWGQRSLVLDRDALPLTVLQNLMGWAQIARVWLPAWRRDQEEVISSITQMAVALALGEQTPSDSRSGDLDFGLPESEPSQNNSVSENRKGDSKQLPYSPWNGVRHIAFPEDMEYNTELVTELLTEIGNDVGPLPVETAIKLAAKCFEVNRMSAARLEANKLLLPQHLTIQTEFGDFLFPKELVTPGGKVSENYESYRVSIPSERKIMEISPHETTNAIVDIVQRSHSIDRVELADEVLNTFGYSRKTAEAQKLAMQRIDWAISTGSVQLNGNKISPS